MPVSLRSWCCTLLATTLPYNVVLSNQSYASGPDHNCIFLHRLLWFGSHGGLRTSLAKEGLLIDPGLLLQICFDVLYASLLFFFSTSRTGATMSSWFSQKLTRAFNATAAGAAGTKRTRLDCSSSIASGGEGNTSASPSPAEVSKGNLDQHQQTEQLLTAKVSTDHFADLEHSQSAFASSHHHQCFGRMPASVNNSGSRNNLDPRDTKRRCFHNDANHQRFSDSALPQYNPHYDHGFHAHAPASSDHVGAYGRDQGFFSSWPGSEHHPHHPHAYPHQRAYSSGTMMQMEPAYHNHQVHALPFSPSTSAGVDGYHRHSSFYSSSDQQPTALPPTAPTTTSSKSPKHTLLAASAKSQLSFQRQNSAFSSIADLDPDDAEVQEHNMLSPQPPRPKAMPSPYYGNHPAGGHWYPSHHQPPVSGYPYYHLPPQPPMAEGYYGHPPIASPAQRSHRNLSCYSSPRHSIHGGGVASTFGASAMWSTMKVGPHVRPNNPMATLFNYVGEEHRHMRGTKNPSSEEYYVVTNHACSDDEVSEITLDTIYDRHDPAARYIEECVDEYPEYREPAVSSARSGRCGAESRVPLSIDIPTVHENEPLEACGNRHAPRHQSIHRVSNNGDSIKASPKNRNIQRIVSCDEQRLSPMVM